MDILYIGQYTEGTTSKMRADQIYRLLKPDVFKVIDTHIPFHQISRFWRSLGFRYKRGPLIKKINEYIIDKVKDDTPKTYGLIWIDKAIFLTPKTTAYLKTLTDKLVHFTPDMAFYSNKSNLFERGIKYYDFLISTKTAEKALYLKYASDDKLILTTQGYDKEIHQPRIPFNQKENAVAFIGLCEPSREKMIEQLINHKIKVNLVGKGWQNFVKKHINNSYLVFHAEGLFSEAYSEFLSSSLFSLGLLSKNFPELHTTRTFEIPACGTALITERNEETNSFFTEDEAIFFNKTEEMIKKINYYQNHLSELEVLCNKGMKRLGKDGRDYESILYSITSKLSVS